MVIRSEDCPNHEEHDDDKHDDDEHDEDKHADDQDNEADQGKEQEGAGARVGGDGGQVLEPQASLGVSVTQTRS